jgi:hypothetical protein
MYNSGRGSRLYEVIPTFIFHLDEGSGTTLTEGTSSVNGQWVSTPTYKQGEVVPVESITSVEVLSAKSSPQVGTLPIVTIGSSNATTVIQGSGNVTIPGNLSVSNVVSTGSGSFRDSLQVVANSRSTVETKKLGGASNDILRITSEQYKITGNGYYITGGGGLTNNAVTWSGSNVITYSFWLKNPQAIPTVTGGYNFLSFVGGDQYILRYPSNGFGLHTTGTGVMYGPDGILTSDWTMFTYAKTANTAYLYVNGVLVSSVGASHTVNPTMLGNSGLNGIGIDNYVIWVGITLSQDQITTMYANGRGLTHYDVVPTYEYRFNEGSGSSAIDSASGQSATHVSTPTYTDSPVNWVSERVDLNIAMSESASANNGMTTPTISYGDTNANVQIAGKDLKFTPVRWDDITVAGIALRSGTTSPARKEVTPGSGIYGTGFSVNDDSDFSAQVRHGVASTNASFPNFYYNPHIHVSTPVVTAPNTNATFVLTWQIAPVNSNYVNTIISRTQTVSWTVGETNVHKLVGFGSITNNLLQGADSVVFRGNIERIATPVIGNDLSDPPNFHEAIVDSLDFHFPFDWFGSTAIFGDAP